jgi:hypothetical protein
MEPLWQGHPIFSAAIYLEGVEVLVCRRAVELAKDCYRRFVLETDSANMVRKLNEEEKEKSVLGPLIEDLKISFHDFDQVELCDTSQT